MSTDDENHGSTRLFQIKEDDLAELERIAPSLCDALSDKLGKNHPMGNRLRVQLRRVQAILSDVRWDYGPPLDVQSFPADGPTQG
jgi:hypothetical protein